MNVNDQYKFLTSASNIININNNNEYESINVNINDNDNEYMDEIIKNNNKRHLCANLFCKLCDINEFDSKKIVYKKIALSSIELILITIYCQYFNNIIHNPYCNFLFKCRCTWTWKGYHFH